jgi:hypothetical protein
MAKDPKGTDAKSEQTKLNLRMREIVNNAYSFVRGREYTKQMSNVTFEQLLDEAIDRIEGTPGKVPLRATNLDRVKKIKNDITSAVDTIKAKPPSSWVLTEDTEENVNTPEESSSPQPGSTTTA